MVTVGVLSGAAALATFAIISGAAARSGPAPRLAGATQKTQPHVGLIVFMRPGEIGAFDL
jgi:hypothetical protein